MKEIKFEYGFESEKGIVKKKYFLSQIPFISDLCDLWNVLPICYVRQFTGLKDKNNVEIYEGDIYQVEDGDLYKVFFLNGAFCGGKSIYSCSPFGFKCEEAIDYEYSGEVIVSDFNKIVVVVGNIYEKK